MTISRLLGAHNARFYWNVLLLTVLVTQATITIYLIVQIEGCILATKEITRTFNITDRR